MKKKKSAQKLLRMHCPDCGSTQNSLFVQCSECKHDLHPELASQDLAKVNGEVLALNEALKLVANPGKSNPYQPVDQAYGLLKGLKRYLDFPGMKAFLHEARQQLLPFKIHLLQRTFKANLIFLLVLIMFPVVPLIAGWAWMVVALLSLPVVVWGGITFKAYRDYKKALAQKE